MAANSLALIDECDIVFGHIFPFSPRAGTPAARMPQLDRATVRRRAAELRARSLIRRAAWLRTLVGTSQAVLAERGGRGHAPNFAHVAFEGEAPMPGSIISTIITGHHVDGLTGRAA